MARAALLLHEATSDNGYLQHAERLIALIEKHYADPDSGGFFMAADDTPGLIVRNKTASDNPAPSGNGVAAEVLARLWLLTGKDAYRARAHETAIAFSGEIARNFFPLSTLLSAAEFLMDPIQVAVIGEPDSPDTVLLADTALSAAPPNRVIQIFEPGRSLPHGHPARGKVQLESKATAYVCRGQSCSLPITEPGVLAESFARD
jgi:uncharacterized protein YyaL (SSP411 family)